MERGAGGRRAEAVEGRGWGLIGHCGMHWQGRDNLSGCMRFAIGGLCHHGDKAITPAIPRLNEALRLPVVAKSVAQGLETVFNRGIAGSLSRPDLFTQFLLGNHTVAVRQKIRKHLELFGSQSNRLASPAQEITLCVEEAIRKEVEHGLNLFTL